MTVHCKICNAELASNRSIGLHLRHNHPEWNIKKYYDTFYRKEKEGICPVCGKETSFISFRDGYFGHCSTKCMTNDPEIQRKMQNTCLERYGETHVSKVNVFKEKIKETNLERYGVPQVLQSEKIKEKIKNTMIETYGVDHQSRSKEVQEKRKQTCREKYGTEHPMQNSSIKQKMINTHEEKYGGLGYQSDEIYEKVKKTNLERYGSEYPVQNEDIKKKIEETNLKNLGAKSPFGSDKVKEKIKETHLKKYGVDTPWKAKVVRDKIKKTNLARYGVDNPSKAEEVKEKLKKTFLNKYGIDHQMKVKEIQEKARQTKIKNIKEYIEKNDYSIVKDLDILYTLRIFDLLNIKTEMYQGLLLIKNSDINMEKFKELDEKFKRDTREYNSKYEVEIHEWLKSVYSGEILVNKYGIIKDDTKKQLDFYIPDKNLAIEFNGDFTHSTSSGKDKDYHLNKTKLCQEKGIRLIHIFEHEWNTKRDIVKSIVCSASGIYEKRLYARNCEIREVSSKEAKEFLEKNHLQGSINSSYRIGLCYNNELVQLLCFGKNRFKKNEIELLRMCTKLNHQVVGGFSKLLKYQPYNNFISYIDLSKFSAQSYLKNNFKIISQSAPNYKYIRGDQIVNRLNAQKHKLPKLLGNAFDAKKTESQNMQDTGWWKIYDCGNLKVKYENRSMLK